MAARDFAPGEVVIAITGREVRVPTRYTLQLGPGLHVDAEPEPEAVGGYPEWRFLNHACEPNTSVRGRSFVARRAIRRGDELTFDYESTEWDMATPFLCECKSRHCRSMIRGYRHLSAKSRTAIGTMAAPHLLALAMHDGAAS